jgi:hypothetical protein
MFEKTSRYYSLETATYPTTRADGSTASIRYKRRRFLPTPGDPSTMITHIVVQGERLDMIATRYAGDPLQFWRIADSNLAARPRELTDRLGAPIVIPILGSN